MASSQPQSSDQDQKRDGNGHAHDSDGRIKSAAEQNKSLPNLVEDAIGHATGLMREEVRLARTEITDGVKTMQSGAISVGVGVAVLLPAVTLLLYAAAFGISAAGLPLWASAAIVGGVAAVIGAILLMAGKKKMDPEHLSAPRAADDAQRTARFAKEQAR
ncbi:MAG: phage holin family protein [Oceanicaulis sp.]